jgi:TIR domain
MLDAPDVFLSYSSKDREIVRKLVFTLEKLNYRVWWDRNLKPGQLWDDAIQQKLAAAKCVIVVWSSGASHSDWVRIEAQKGLDRKVLVPIRIEKVDPPNPFDKIHAGDLTDWKGEAWHDGLHQCLERVKTLVEAGRMTVDNLPRNQSSRTRALDAAIDSHVQVGRPSDLIVMVRRADSDGLRAILVADPSYSMTPNDVRSAPGVVVEFPVSRDGSLGEAELQLRVLSGSFAVEPAERRIRLAPDCDSQVIAFMVTPKHEGALKLTIDLYQESICRATRVLSCSGVTTGIDEVSRGKHIVSMTMMTSSVATPIHGAKDSYMPLRQGPPSAHPDTKEPEVLFQPADERSATVSARIRPPAAPHATPHAVPHTGWQHPIKPPPPATTTPPVFQAELETTPQTHLPPPETFAAPNAPLRTIAIRSTPHTRPSGANRHAMLWLALLAGLAMMAFVFSR